VACPEEVALSLGLIDEEAVLRLAEPLRSSGYGEYLVGLVEGRRR
jgi:glucose-1-phosphate thymidylyltransferase